LGDAVPAFDRAYRTYWETGAVPDTAEDLLFRAVWSSAGTAPRRRAQELGRRFDANRFSGFADDLLHDLDSESVAAALEADGYYVAPARLSDAVVASIADVLDRGPASPQGDGLGSLPPGVPVPAAPTWWVAPRDSLRSSGVRRLMVQRRLAEIGGRYLGVDPLIMSIALWKSFAWRAPDKLSAQYFHCDNDRAAFVKMFVYLTDVGERNGPHVYVAGSHRAKPKQLLHGMRLTDRAVERFYPRDEWVTIQGGKGTIFFADTAGLHKGGPMLEGERGVFQVNLASDRFGVFQPVVASAEDAPEDLQPFITAVPRFFSQLFSETAVAP
jgi:hypothetical protein